MTINLAQTVSKEKNLPFRPSNSSILTNQQGASNRIRRSTSQSPNSTTPGASSTSPPGNPPSTSGLIELGTTLPARYKNEGRDYELFKITNIAYKVPNRLPKPYHGLLPKWTTHLTDPPTADVLVMTGPTGVVLGRLSGMPFFLRMPGRRLFQEMWVVKLTRRASKKSHSIPQSALTLTSLSNRRLRLLGHRQNDWRSLRPRHCWRRGDSIRGPCDADHKGC
jgi:hypothetical protein